VTLPAEVWIWPRSMMSSSYPVALAPMTLRFTSARPAGLYQPAVESATRATKAPDSSASSWPMRTRS